jgi:hypothetical protein
MSRLLIFFLFVFWGANQPYLYAQRVFKAKATTNYLWYLVLNEDSTYRLYTPDSIGGRPTYGTGKYKESNVEVVLDGSRNFYPDSTKIFGSADSLYIQLRFISKSRNYFLHDGKLDTLHFFADHNGWVRLKRPAIGKQYLELFSERNYQQYFLFIDLNSRDNTFYFTVNEDKFYKLNVPYLLAQNPFKKVKNNCAFNLVFMMEVFENESYYFDIGFIWSREPMIFEPLAPYEVYPTFNLFFEE